MLNQAKWNSFVLRYIIAVAAWTLFLSTFAEKCGVFAEKSAVFFCTQHECSLNVH
jgi:hypothetical protein